MIMVKNIKQSEDEWQAAQAELRVAQAIPIGPDRIAALKKAGQRRYNANKIRMENDKAKGNKSGSA